MKYQTIIALLLFALTSCDQKTPSQEAQLSKADQVFEKTFERHGGSLYDKANYEFVFRGKTYEFDNDAYGYEYKMIEIKGDTTIVDEIVNGSLMRMVNQKEMELSKKDYDKYLEALNSVIYFATLPHKLQDGAVNKEYVGETEIKGKRYDILGVNFDQEGGGKDHDDNFMYWINKSTNLIDYLAYDYTTNDGGVRFREANNTRTVAGIIFQDYVNYKAEVGTALVELPALYERGELEKLSEINTENVKSLNITD